MLVVLSAAAGISLLASIYGYALTSARIIVIQPAILGTAIAVMAGGCAALVPRQGAMGAAWAIVLGSAVQVLASAAALRFLPSTTARRDSRSTPPPLKFT